MSTVLPKYTTDQLNLIYNAKQNLKSTNKHKLQMSIQ